MRSASSKAGGVYLYANQRGGDGSRLYYDGCALVACNGDILAQGSQFGLQARAASARNSARNSRRSLDSPSQFTPQDVEVIVATIDLQQVRSARAAVPSRSRQAAIAPAVHRVHVDFILGAPAYGSGGVPVSPTAEIAARLHRAEEEIALGPACWLWDYLRRSGAGGYFLPLSGGADSSSTAAIVGIMCQLVVKAAAAGDEQVITDVRKVTRKAAPWLPADAKELCGMILHTCYMGTENSSAATRGRAAALAAELGAHHTLADIGPMVKGVIATFEAITSKSPKFKSQGGTETEDLALQNIQARSRMVLSYTLAQLLPWTRDRPSFLLVLGSANVDEALAGYTMGRVSTCASHAQPTLLTSRSSPLQLHDKVRLLECRRQPDRRRLEGRPQAVPAVRRRRVGLPLPPRRRRGAADRRTPPALRRRGRADRRRRHGDDVRRALRVWKAAEDAPLRAGVDVPAAAPRWLGSHSAAAIADKVKHFFKRYGQHRHKLTTLTPAYHAESYSPDDNRFDLRQFLYPRWERSSSPSTRSPRRWRAAAAVAAVGGKKRAR